MAGIDLSSSLRSDDTSPSPADTDGEGGPFAPSDGITSNESAPTSEENTDATISFDAEIREETDSGETLALQVHVEASQDAFPENTSMSVELTRDQDVIDSISNSVPGRVTAVHSVDVSFADENGEPVNPAEGSQVSVTLFPMRERNPIPG